MKNLTKDILIAAAAFLLIAFILSVKVVGAGDRGVVTTWGAFHGFVLQPGLHFIIPIAQGLNNISVQTQTLTVDNSEAYSKDLQMVNIASMVNYNIKPDGVGEYFTQYNGRFDNILTPRLEAAIKQVVAKYTAEELLRKRGEVQSEIASLYRQSAPTIIEVTSFSIVNEAFTPEYEKAIEQKQIAQQSAEKAKNDLEKIKTEAEQRIVQSKAEAEAIKIQAEAIQQQGGAAYVQLQWIEAWKAGGAKVPQVISGDGGNFLINTGDLKY